MPPHVVLIVLVFEDEVVKGGRQGLSEQKSVR